MVVGILKERSWNVRTLIALDLPLVYNHVLMGSLTDGEVGWWRDSELRFE
jgi:hypothetical protein